MTDQPQDPLSTKLLRLNDTKLLHPMAVHIPNGMVPVAALFMGAGCLFKFQPLIWAALFNLGMIFLAMPWVLLTGVASWKFRYRGAKTPLFKTKIRSSIVLFAGSGAIIVWQIFRPVSAESITPEAWAMAAAYAALLIPTAWAGSLGGKLVFGPRKKL